MLCMLFIFICLIITVTPAAINEDNNIKDKILYQDKNQDEIGNYKFSYLTKNGLWRTENGKVLNVGEPNEHIVVEGSYSYLDPDGKYVEVHYVADENGFQILPSTTSPPIGVTPSPEPPSAAYPPQVVATLLGGG